MIKRILFLLIVLLLFFTAIPLFAQTQIQTGPVDPATCDPTIGQLWFNNSTVPAVLKSCTAVNTWTAVGGGAASVAFPWTQLASTGTPALSLSNGNVNYFMTVTGNVTSVTMPGGPATNGQYIGIDFKENGTGGFTIPTGAFPGNVIFPTGCTFNTNANADNWMAWTFDGTNFQPVPGTCAQAQAAGAAGTVQKAGAAGSLAASSITDNGTTVTVAEPLTSSGAFTASTTAAITGNLTTNVTGITSQCVHANTSGVLSGTGADCGTPPGAPSLEPQCGNSGGTAFQACGNNVLVQYILTGSGNDSNSGKSWDTAKKTIASACAALTGGNSSCTAGAGTIITTSPSVFLPQGTNPNITLRILGVDGEANSGPNPTGINIQDFGARTFISTPSTVSVTVTGGTNSLATGGVADFIVGDDIVIPTGGTATGQTTPGAPTVTPIGVTGSQTINYKCVGIDSQWGLTAASALGSTNTAPQVFGQAANAISSATWAANTVTVNTTLSMPFNTGTFHAMITDITSGGNQIGGIQLVNVVSATQLTYTLTGSGTVTVVADSSVQFVNAFVLTQVSSSAGSQYITLTTDTNHTFQQQLASSNPTKLFLDGINFAGELLPGFANGVFTIDAVTSNTIRVKTPYTAALTQNASSSSTFATSKVNQMTAFVWATMQVTCPQNANGTPSDGGVQYAIYADYTNSGTYAPVGVTPYNHSIFIDYGSFANKANYVSPPAMSLPATPPVSAQTRVFETKITGISGSTITTRDNIPTGVTSQTSYHSNGASLLAAVDEACRRSDGLANKGWYPVVIPQTDNGASVYFLFNAPVNLNSSPAGCNRFSIVDGGAVWLNGTISSANSVEWVKPVGGYLQYLNTSGGTVPVFGHGNPMMASSPNAPWTVRGMAFTPVAGEVGFYNEALDSRFENDVFQANSGNYLTDIPMELAGNGFDVHLRDITFGTVPNPNAPLSANCGNCGAIMWWPVPTFLVLSGGQSQPDPFFTGNNYGNGRGIEFSAVYPGAVSPQSYTKFENIYTFQEPWQPLINLTGGLQMRVLELTNIVMDSIQMPVVGNLCSNCKVMLSKEIGPFASGHPSVTGFPFSSVSNINDGSLAANYGNQQSTEEDFNQSGRIFGVPVYANDGLIVTQTAYDNATRANGAIGSPWVLLQTTNALNITSNQFSGGSASDNMAFYSALNAPVGGEGQYSKMTLPVLSGRSGPMLYITPSAQNSSSGTNYICTESASTLAISNGNGSGPLTTLATQSVTGANGDTVFFYGVPNYVTNQTVLNCLQNSFPPAAATVTTTVNGLLSGFPGMDIFGTTTRGSAWVGGYWPPIAQQNIETEIFSPWHFDQGLTGTTATITTLTAGGIVDTALPTSPNAICPNGTGGAFTTVGCTAGGTPGAPSLSFQYNNSGVFGGIGPSTAPNNVPKTLQSTAISGVGTVGTLNMFGVVPRSNACTANADTILATDRANRVLHTTQAGADCVVTLPQAGSGGGGNTDFTANYAYKECNVAASAHNVIVTPTTSTINGASTLTLSAGQCAFIDSDNTNYTADISSSLPSVTSFTGDGTFATNSGSTGSVTLTLANAPAHKYLGNNTGSPAAPAYDAIANADLPGTGCMTVGGTSICLGGSGSPAGPTIIRANEGVTGTHTNKLVKYTGAPSTAIDTANADTGGFIGVCISGCTTTGNATIQQIGDVSCVFDGATTAGDYVINSPTAAPDCHDAGTNNPLTATLLGQIVGKVLSTNGATGTYTMTQIPPDSNLLNVVSNTTGNATAANQVIVSSGTAKAVKAIDYPEALIIQAANCNNAQGGAGWSIGPGGVVNCRAGTNNLGGYIAITDTSTTFAQFMVVIPQDWDTSTNPYIRFQFGYPGTDTGHTIIPQIKVSCSKGDGTTTDDVAFNAAHSLSTTTTNATANQFWSGSNVQMNGTDMTGCVAGAMMIIQVGRATDTATSAANFYSATVTIPRLIVVQAN